MRCQHLRKTRRSLNWTRKWTYLSLCDMPDLFSISIFISEIAVLASIIQYSLFLVINWCLYSSIWLNLSTWDEIWTHSKNSVTRNWKKNSLLISINHWISFKTLNHSTKKLLKILKQGCQNFIFCAVLNLNYFLPICMSLEM